MAYWRIVAFSVCVGVAGCAGARADTVCSELAEYPGPCAGTALGAVLAPDAAVAGALASAMPRAERAFSAHFGRDAHRYVVAIGAENRGRIVSLREHGLVVLPWLTEAERGTSVEASIRAAVEPRLRAAGMTDEQINRQVASAVAQAQNSLASRGPDAGIVAHELGHLWLRAAFAADSPSEGEGRYGSTLPDWLDETAAVLMETDELTASRRTQFTTLAREHPERILPLTEYFTREHPIHRQARALAESTGAREGGASVRVVTQQEAESAGMDITGGAAFYAQTRAFADFLTERAGGERVFAAIAESLAHGQSMDAWLSQDGRAWRLPASTAELERDWRGWISERSAG